MIWVLVGLVLGWAGADSGKTQTIRALDVLVLGPLFIFAALGPLKEPWRTALLVSGGATITFNLRNFLREQKQ